MANVQFYLTREGGHGAANLIVLTGNDVIGRGCDARVHLLSKFVSRDHCHIYFDKLTMKWFIRDLGSLNGTYVNNDLIDKAQPSEINLGDFIGFGIDHRNWIFNPQINQDKDYFMFKFWRSNFEGQEACAGGDFSVLCENINRMTIDH